MRPLASGATPDAESLPDGNPHFLEGMVAEITVAPAPSSADPSGASTTASAAVSQSSFESTRHGYRVSVPPGWVVNEYPGAWDDLAQFTPGGEIPGEDAIATDGFSHSWS